MNQLTLSSLVMPAAKLGGANALTPLRGYETASASAGAPDAEPQSPNYPDRGHESSILPYCLKDQYDRCRTARAFKTAVLENDHLRATFLLELGGRLWSLIDKATGRELLFVNPVFQPANLAVRDAWFSGGVEWNVSIIGHSAFTCAPLFAARVMSDDGARATPVLRLYEWDRIRRVPFQIDCWLPDESRFLMVRVRITNPNDHAVPMYWWSNIAVPERQDVRVLAPAEHAYRHDYDGSLVAHDVPVYDGVDVTYTTNRRSAADLYFRIPKGHRPWIAALDRNGSGLVHTSTDRLRGRKMFNWGMDPGGRRWQEFLSEPGQAYIEIQGGLAQTQGEYLTMPAGAEWSWLEAYGLLEADATRVHGKDWTAAHGAVEQALEQRLPRRRMEEELVRSAAEIANREPVELLHHGSGWGALEQLRRARAGQTSFASSALPFPRDSMTGEQLPWLQLLERGALPSRGPDEGPDRLMVQPEWRALLEKSAERADASDWSTWYHLGVMRYRAGDPTGARDAWHRSLAAAPNAWAQRDLAVLSLDEGDASRAADLWLAAARLAPQMIPLAIETAQALSRAHRDADAIAFIDALPDAARAHGRIRLLRALASLALDDLDAVEHYFAGDLDVANIREKETVLSDLWFGWHERKLAREEVRPIDDELRRRVRRHFPPPPRFDFRLNVDRL